MAPLRSAWSASTTKNSAFWPLAVRSITQGRDFAGVTGNPESFPGLALPDARRTYNGNASRDEQENAKHAPQSQRSRDLL